MKTILKASIAAVAICVATQSYAEEYSVFKICQDEHVIHTSDGADAGHIEYIVIDPADRHIVSTVVGGGVLGERQVSIPYESVTYSEGNAIVLNQVTRERLVAAPVFEHTKFVHGGRLDNTYVQQSVSYWGGREGRGGVNVGVNVDAKGAHREGATEVREGELNRHDGTAIRNEGARPGGQVGTEGTAPGREQNREAERPGNDANRLRNETERQGNEANRRAPDATQPRTENNRAKGEAGGAAIDPTQEGGRPANEANRPTNENNRPGATGGETGTPRTEATRENSRAGKENGTHTTTDGEKEKEKSHANAEGNGESSRGAGHAVTEPKKNAESAREGGSAARHGEAAVEKSARGTEKSAEHAEKSTEHAGKAAEKAGHEGASELTK